MISQYRMNNDKILKASNVRKEHSIYRLIAEGLSTVDQLKYVKIYNGRILASNGLSDNGKKEPVVNVGEENIIGAELLIDVDNQVVQFYSITSSEKGCGEMMVKSVVDTVPDDWKIVVIMDWSHGFWGVMAERYTRLMVF
mgnify:CR=1 FL=1